MFDQFYDAQRLKNRKQRNKDTVMRKNKYRDKFRRIFLRLVGVYSNSKNTNPVRLLIQWESRQIGEQSAPQAIVKGLKQEVIENYFRQWKMLYSDQVKREINMQSGISKLSSMLKTFNNHQENLKSLSFYKIVSYSEESYIINHIKQEFRSKKSEKGSTKSTPTCSCWIHVKIADALQEYTHNFKAIMEKQKKYKKIKRWCQVLAFGLLNDLMSKKRHTIIRDVEKAILLSRFLRWKKAVAIHKFTHMPKTPQNQIKNDPLPDRTLSIDSGVLETDNTPLKNHESMIRVNQMMIKKTLENDIQAKQDLIDNRLKYEMAGTVMKSYMVKKKRVLLKKAFKQWNGEIKYNQAVMYHDMIKQPQQFSQ
jgi:hypothetical protein